VDPETDEPAALGTVPTEGRGSLPFCLWHGESLVAAASWALAEAGVRLLDFNTSWSAVRDAAAPLVVHDPLCPATPVAFLRSVVEHARPDGPVVAAVRPVTDTVKVLSDGVVGVTVDRSELVALASPVVLPAGVVAALSDWPDLADLPALVADLAARFGVSFVEAPPEARRIVDESDLRLLAASR
jgi:2-C-methyl-D-erythritol 4-phosphate cytidylyltransferase